MALRKQEVAFAKACGVPKGPRVDDIEAMIGTFPGTVDWDAEPVRSGINLGA